MEGSIGSKGGRFDVYVKPPGRYAFTLEMQVENEDHLPKRTRYYSAMMCEDLLAAGATYAPLPPAYVVMICSFDLFRKGLHRYTFSNRCSGDPSVFPGDGSCVIFLNSKGTADDVSPGILTFLKYMEGIVTEEDPYLIKLDEAVKRAKMNADCRREYMLYEMEPAHEKELSREEGIKEGGRMLLISQVKTGIGRGLDAAAAADRLMTDRESIRPICDLLPAMPEASSGEILEALKKQDREQ